jgi:hypothetical protein
MCKKWVLLNMYSDFLEEYVTIMAVVSVVMGLELF